MISNLSRNNSLRNMDSQNKGLRNMDSQNNSLPKIDSQFWHKNSFKIDFSDLKSNKKDKVFPDF